MSTDTAPGKIHAAIIAIMRAVAPIAKDQRNTQQNYNFRGIDQVYNAVHPHFAEHGVYSTSEVLKADHRVEPRKDKSGRDQNVIHAILTMRFTFWAEDGSHVPTEVVGEGIDYGGDKASNKAMSVADKYAILQLLKIPTAAVDSDRDDARGNGRSRNAELVKLIARTIADTKQPERLDAVSKKIATKDELDEDDREYLDGLVVARREELNGVTA
jgi:hypothetical protein